jgi:branched-chain amino acid transport system substrate-binding protein
VDMVQTYSFSGKLSLTGDRVLAALKSKYPDVKTLADVTPAVGIANAYDAMHLVALAITKAGSTEGPAIRKAMFEIGPYEGLIKTYTKPFTPENHDALSKDDYIFTRFKGPEIVPLTD